MKKFSKICLIIVAVLGGMGLLLGGISALLGGGFGAVRRMAERGELDAGNWHIRPYELYYSSDEEDTESSTLPSLRRWKSRLPIISSNWE